MNTNVGAQVRTSAQIDADCEIEYEVSGEQSFFSFGDGMVALHFSDETAFRKFMGEAMKVLGMLGLSGPDDVMDPAAGR
jgi:hypothetical protein